MANPILGKTLYYPVDVSQVQLMIAGLACEAGFQCLCCYKFNCVSEKYMEMHLGLCRPGLGLGLGELMGACHLQQTWPGAPYFRVVSPPQGLSEVVVDQEGRDWLEKMQSLSLNQKGGAGEVPITLQSQLYKALSLLHIRTKLDAFSWQWDRSTDSSYSNRDSTTTSEQVFEACFKFDAAQVKLLTAFIKDDYFGQVREASLKSGPEILKRIGSDFTKNDQFGSSGKYFSIPETEKTLGEYSTFISRFLFFLLNLLSLRVVDDLGSSYKLTDILGCQVRVGLGDRVRGLGVAPFSLAQFFEIMKLVVCVEIPISKNDWSSLIYVFIVLDMVRKQRALAPHQFEHAVSQAKFMVRSFLCCLLQTDMTEGDGSEGKRIEQVFLFASDTGYSATIATPMSRLCLFSGLLKSIVNKDPGSLLWTAPVSVNSLNGPEGFDLSIRTARFTDLKFRSTFKSLLQDAQELMVDVLHGHDANDLSLVLEEIGTDWSSEERAIGFSFFDSLRVSSSKVARGKSLLTSFSENAKIVKWSNYRVSEWLGKTDRLMELLLVLMHTSGGKVLLEANLKELLHDPQSSSL
jgi:hypothetical protein